MAASPPRPELEAGEREELVLVLPATLALLAAYRVQLFQGAGRYDQRKTDEEQEANAIGTEYLRVGLLPTADAAEGRRLLRSYLVQRILFYTTADPRALQQIETSTAHIENNLWSVVQTAAITKPTPVTALVASGMNDTLNSQGYTEAAWRNRIPASAWFLMIAIAICCNVLAGFEARPPPWSVRRVFLLPAIVAIAFFLVADLDSPRHGAIRVTPQNLTSLSASLNGH